MTMGFDIDRKSNGTRAVLAAALLVGSALAAGAQDTQLASSDARWGPWIGCWQSSSRDAVSMELAPNKAAPVICFMPATGNGTVDFVAINDGTAGTPEHVDANGTRRAVDREGCTGWEIADFSADAKRIYLHSEHQCTGNRTRTSTGIMSMTPYGEWLDVQGVKVNEHSGVRVARYDRVPIPPALNADFRSKIEAVKLATNTAVIAASDSVRIADVIEASKKLDPLVLQTWLTERGQGFNLDAKRLTQLADAKVPSSVIDVMVALTYPQTFAVNLAQADGQVVQAAGAPEVAAMDDGMHAGPAIFMNWDPFYSNGYSYGYGYRYGTYGFGNGNAYGGTWYGGRPIVLVKPTQLNLPQETNGKMVRGRGYTHGGSGGGSGSVSPSGRTSGGSSSSGSTGRTAKPRP